MPMHAVESSVRLCPPHCISSFAVSPMFVIDNAQASLSFAEVNDTGDPFATIVRETRGRVTREMQNTDPAWHSHFTLVTAGT